MLGALALSVDASALDAVTKCSASQNAAEPTQPESWILPQGDRAALVARGAGLFDDPSIGESDCACSTSHMNFENDKDRSGQPYPHGVAMDLAVFGMDDVTAAEMVQLCMVAPMATDTLFSDGDDLAALTSHVEDEQQRFVAR
jgi:hypothetical protein